MKVIAYLPSYNEKHCQVLEALVEGIPGAETRILGRYERCDVAIIFGSYKRSYPVTKPKREILNRHEGRRLLMVESAFMKRGEYYQVGWGGFAGNADFNCTNPPIDRWLDLGVECLPWRSDPDGPILVCGQVPWDTQVQDTDHRQWCQSTVHSLVRQGHKVLFVPHPREKKGNFGYGVNKKYLARAGLSKLLPGAKCVVTWNSTSAVDAILAGVPAITMHSSSIAYEVSQHSLSDIERLEFPDRHQWLAKLGYAQWTLDEMRSGATWEHLTANYEDGK